MIFAMQKESCIMKGSLRRDVEPDFAKKLVAFRSHQHRVHTGHRVKANFPVQKPIFSYFSDSS